MIKYIVFTIIFLLVEVLLAFLFQVAAQVFYKKLGFDFKSIMKGVAERLFLMIALSNDYSQALTFFSAIKLATRLKHQEKAEETNRFNDYYLVGNLASVAVGIGYTYLLAHLDSFLAFLKTVF